MNDLRWATTFFFVSSPIVMVFGLVYLHFAQGIHTQTLWLSLVMYMISGVGISAGYHRLISHRSFGAHAWFRATLLVMGACAFTSSALNFASNHRRHHRFTDTLKDPHSTKRGWFFAHIGWACIRAEISLDNVHDLTRDKLVMWQHRYHWWLAIACGWALPIIIAYSWDDPLGGLVIAVLTRIVIFHHCMFLINSYSHIYGRQPHSHKTSARDSNLVALLTFGEGYHNYHHTCPGDYRVGAGKWQFDPIKWIIWILSHTGVTRDLRRRK